MKLKFPRKVWVENSHQLVCAWMDTKYLGPTDPEIVMEVILERIQRAEEDTDQAAIETLYRVYGLTLFEEGK